VRRLSFLSAWFVLLGCGDESTPPQVADVWEPASYGTFITDACGVGLSNFDESHWDHRDGSSTLHLEMAQGCGVYQGTIEFTENRDLPHMSTWEVTTQMCNRCSDSRYLRWVRLRGYDEIESPVKELPDFPHLSFGPGLDSIQGPDSGDGLSGYIRYLDVHGAEYLSQCSLAFPISDEYFSTSPLGKVVHQVEVVSGEWVSTATGWTARYLFHSQYLGQTPESTSLSTAPLMEAQPVNFLRLAQTHYLWPKFHTEPSAPVADFPSTECLRLGYSTYDELWHYEPLGGFLVRDRGYQDWIPQEFNFEPPDVFTRLAPGTP